MKSTRNSPFAARYLKVIIGLSAALLLQTACLAPQHRAPAAPAVVAPVVSTQAPGAGGDIVNYGQIHHPVVGRGGMVVSQSGLATQVGVQILRKGGNAVDAAIAVGLAEAVTLPRAGNLGGGGYMLVHMAAGGGKPPQTVAINYYGIAPRNMPLDYLLKPDGSADRSRPTGFHNVSVPGTVAGLWEAHQRFGSLTWKELVAPAIALAEEGVILSDAEADATARRAHVLALDPGAREAYLKPDGSTYRAGELFRQPQLAWSLGQVRDGGVDAFYRGELARRIVAGIRAGGGIIDEQDFASYQADVSEPVWSSYRGHPIAFSPPTASGISVAQALNMLEHFPVAGMGWGSAEGMHLLAETMKVVNSDRRLIGPRPHFNTPSRGIASKGYAAERVKLVAPDKVLTAAELPDGDPWPYESRDTTHYSVADAAGNVVSNTYTISNSYGAHVAAPGTGILLNDHLGNFAWGDTSERMRAKHPAPGKKLGSTITPMIVFDQTGQTPWLVTGTPGGYYIVGTMVQLMVNIIDHRLNIAEASMRPRMAQLRAGGPLELEGGFSPDTERLLRERGHRVQPTMALGSTQTIEIRDGLFYGAADTRRPDASAAGVH